MPFLLIFSFLVALLLAGLLLWPWLQNPLGPRLARLSSPARQQAASQRQQAERLLKQLPVLAKLAEAESSATLRRRLVSAGYRQPTAAQLFGTAKLLLILLLTITALIATGFTVSSTHLLADLAAATLGYYLPDLWLSHQLRRRREALLAQLPDALELITVCLEAGLSFHGAFLRVVGELDEHRPALKEELNLMLLEIASGASREQALRHLAERVNLEDVSTLVTMLIQAERFGTSVAEALRLFTDMLRQQLQLRAEEHAAKISTKLLFPMMLCILPVILIVILAPAAWQIIHVLLPALSQGGN